MNIELDQIREIWHQNLNDGYKFQVYIRSPFCKKICKFCAYKGKIFKKEAYDIYYRKYLPELIKAFASVIRLREVDSFYFGGGTPSLMETKEMYSIFSMIPSLKEVSNKYFEIHPAFFNKAKIQILKEFNFQTLTFGIQTFNEEEIKKMNRYEQNFNHILELVKSAKDLGLKTGIDLLIWEGNERLYEDLLIADDLEFDVIFATIDYNLERPDNILKYFEDSVNKFLSRGKYSVIREKSIGDIFNFNTNIRMFRDGEDCYEYPGVFDYDSNFGAEFNNDSTATLALGSYGKQMVPTVSNIGGKIVYEEANENWEPVFNLIKKRKLFTWRTENGTN